MSSSPLAPANFAARLATELQHQRPSSQWVHNEHQFCLRCEDPEAVLNLGNFYAEHEQLPPETWEAHLRKSALAILSSHQNLPEDLEQARHDLRLKLWCRSVIDKLDLQTRIEGQRGIDMPLVPVGEHLYASVVYVDFAGEIRCRKQQHRTGIC